MLRRTAALLVSILLVVAIAAVTFMKEEVPEGPAGPITEAMLIEMGPNAVSHLRSRSMSQNAESLDAVALSFLARAQGNEADDLLVDLLQGETDVDGTAALEMLLFELPEAERRLLTNRPKVRTALLERASSGSPKTRAFVQTMRAEDGF
ncbi:MAG: hypothetical protein AAF368_06375 [Planctomycetota bacterium]